MRGLILPLPSLSDHHFVGTLMWIGIIQSHLAQKRGPSASTSFKFIVSIRAGTVPNKKIRTAIFFFKKPPWYISGNCFYLLAQIRGDKKAIGGKK
jgi:hypothetical protein